MSSYSVSQTLNFICFPYVRQKLIFASFLRLTSITGFITKRLRSVISKYRKNVLLHDHAIEHSYGGYVYIIQVNEKFRKLERGYRDCIKRTRDKDIQYTA